MTIFWGVLEYTGKLEIVNHFIVLRRLHDVVSYHPLLLFQFSPLILMHPLTCTHC